MFFSILLYLIFHIFDIVSCNSSSNFNKSFLKLVHNLDPLLNANNNIKKSIKTHGTNIFKNSGL